MKSAIFRDIQREIRLYPPVIRREIEVVSWKLPIVVSVDSNHKFRSCFRCENGYFLKAFLYVHLGERSFGGAFI